MGFVLLVSVYIFTFVLLGVCRCVSLCVFGLVFVHGFPLFVHPPFWHFGIFTFLTVSKYKLIKSWIYSAEKKRESGPLYSSKKEYINTLKYVHGLSFYEKIMPNLLVNISISGPSIRPSIVPFLF